MENQIKKPERKVNMPISEYRKLKRREQQLMRAKNHIRIAWQTLKQVSV